MQRFLDSDIFYSFKRSPLVMAAAAVIVVYIVAALFAPWVAPHNPFDLKTLNLLDAFTPPSWTDKGNPTYSLGTDDQGRDVLSAIIFGSRMSLLVGLLATLLAMVLGVSLFLTPSSADLVERPELLVLRVIPSVLIAIGPRIQELQTRANPVFHRERRVRPYNMLPYLAIAVTFVGVTTASTDIRELRRTLRPAAPDAPRF